MEFLEFLAVYDNVLSAVAPERNVSHLLSLGPPLTNDPDGKPDSLAESMFLRLRSLLRLHLQILSELYPFRVSIVSYFAVNL